MKHNIVLKGYGAHLPTTPSKLLRLGTAESYGVEQLHITPGADWENLLIKATFHPPSGDSVVVVLGEDGIINVPPEATAVAAGEYNPGLIVFSGVTDGVQRISADIAYTVLGHAPVDGKDSEPTPNQWEQLATQYQSKVDKQQGAENAGKVLGIGEDGMVKPVEQSGGGGGVGNNGATFIPSVDKDGFISWTNDGDLPNPEPVNIKGPIGKTPVKGEDYFTEADKQEIAQEAAGRVKIPTALPNPNALTFTGAVEGTYDGSAPLTVEIPQGGSGVGGDSAWKLLLDTTLAEDVVNVCIELDTPVQEFFIKGRLGGDGTNRAITLFSVTSVGYGKNMFTFKDVLRKDEAVEAWVAIYGMAFQNYARFICDYCPYNSNLSYNTPIQGGSTLAFDESTNSTFLGTAFEVINIGCWNAGVSGVFKAGSRIEIWGR